MKKVIQYTTEGGLHVRNGVQLIRGELSDGSYVYNVNLSVLDRDGLFTDVVHFECRHGKAAENLYDILKYGVTHVEINKEPRA